MRINNLSVAKKVWLLVGMVMLVLIGTSLITQRYVAQLESELRNEMQLLEDRTRTVVQLRGSIEAGASTIVAAAFAHDAVTRKSFEEHFKLLQAGNAQIMQRLDKELRSAEARTLLAQLTQTIQKADAQIAQLEQERSEGGDLGAFVRSKFTPIIDQALTVLDSMVQLQAKLLQDALSQGDAQRQQATLQVLAVFAALVIAALLLAHMLVQQVTAPLNRAVALANEIAAGDLTGNVHDDRQDELGMLLRALQSMNVRLRAVIGEVRNGVDSVSSAASQIASGNHDLSARTEQTAANLEETAASVEEMAATITQSADTARQANQLASSAAQAAQRGGEVVNQVVQSMDQINTSSRKISDIIGVIDGIAFQTNILALNAAVEAARAGEQGRGFAVVAGEVRNLAQRSAEAAKEIKALINTSVSNVDKGAAQVMQAGESMEAIVTSVRRVTDLIGEITASATEQRDGITQVNQAVSNLDQMTQQNASLVEESSAAAMAMNEQAQRLAQVVDVFKLSQNSAGLVPPSKMPANVPAVSAVTPKPVQPPLGSTRKPLVPSVASAVVRKDPEIAVQSPKAAKDDDWETF